MPEEFGYLFKKGRTARDGCGHILVKEEASAFEIEGHDEAIQEYRFNGD